MRRETRTRYQYADNRSSIDIILYVFFLAFVEANRECERKGNNDGDSRTEGKRKQIARGLVYSIDRFCFPFSGKANRDFDLRTDEKEKEFCSIDRLDFVFIEADRLWVREGKEGGREVSDADSGVMG